MRLLLITLMALLLAGCTVSDRTNTELPSDTVITLEGNQSIGYRPNSEVLVQIVNVGDGAYYIWCDAGECPVTIDNSTDDNRITDSHNTAPAAIIEP